jgi:hydrogenase-4 component E
MLVLVVLTDVALYFSSRLILHIRVVAAQGLLLGVLPLVVRGGTPDSRLAGMAAVTIAVKAVGLPWLLARTVRRTGILSEAGQHVGHVTASIVGLALLGLATWLAGNLPLPNEALSSRCLTVAFFTVLSGLFLCVARDRLVSQTIGCLVLENGVLLAGLAVPQEVPALVELGVLLDVTVAVFVMVVLIQHVKREFASVDVDRLAELRD